MSTASTSKGKGKASAPEPVAAPKPKPKQDTLTTSASDVKGKGKAPEASTSTSKGQPAAGQPKPPRVKGMSYELLSRCIIDFIETAVHSILYIRNVYPPEVFQRRQRWKVPVWQSEHPGLNKYIREALFAVHNEMKQGKVEKVIVILKNGMDIALERWIFAVHNMLELESWNVNEKIVDGFTPEHLALYFKSFMLKLSLTESSLEPLELGEFGSFAIIVEMRAKTKPDVDGNQFSPWIPAEKTHTTAGQGDEAEIQLIRAMNTGVINLSLAVQETEDKKFLEEEKVREAEEKKKKEERVIEDGYYYNY